MIRSFKAFPQEKVDVMNAASASVIPPPARAVEIAIKGLLLSWLVPLVLPQIRRRPLVGWALIIAFVFVLQLRD